jgi:muramoyltetrapeptide carboxypeptidase
VSASTAALRPPRLRPGARVALIAPAGPVSEAKVTTALMRCAALGLEPVLGAGARDRAGYLAGPDDVRARDLNHAIADPGIDAIWALRGGYGTMRLLPALDLAPLRARPKAFIGFSDNTALHHAFARAGLVSFHGPHAASPFPAFTAACFQRVLFQAEPAGVLPIAIEDDPPCTLAGGVGEGILGGGNLSLLASLCGTEISFDARGRIVVLEDVGEPLYRVDRALTQLLLAGALDGAAGLTFGRFTESPSSEGRLEDVLGGLAHTLGVPAVHGFPVGHVDHNWCLPFGVRARLDADRGVLEIVEPAVC